MKYDVLMTSLVAEIYKAETERSQTTKNHSILGPKQ